MPSPEQPELLDAAGRAAARQRIADFVASAQAAQSPAFDQAVYEQAQRLMAAGDPSDQKFLLEQVQVAPTGHFGGLLALLLVGVENQTPGRFDAQKAAGPEILRELGRLLAVPQPWNYLWRAATFALFLADRDGFTNKLRPFLVPATPADPRARERVEILVATALSAEDSPATLELALTASQLLDGRGFPIYAGYNDNFAHVSGYLGGPGNEEKLAQTLELDLQPDLFARLFRFAVCNSAMRLVAKHRKRILPAIQAVAPRLRGDPKGLVRLKAVDQALELGGALLSTEPVKLPKALPRVAIKLKLAGASEGGPMLALPKEAIAAWGGALDPKTGKPPPSGNFAGTDYGRACAISEGPLKSPWGGFGFLQAGGHTGLVLGRSVSTGRMKDGSYLLLMDEADEAVEEDVGAFLKGEPRWQDLEGVLQLPSGALVIFDSACEGAKTNNKSVLKLPPGSYRVQEHHADVKGSAMWLFRLSLAEPRGPAHAPRRDP